MSLTVKSINENLTGKETETQKKEVKKNKQIKKIHERSLSFSYFAHIFSYPESAVLQLFPSSPPDINSLKEDYTKLLLCKNEGQMVLSPLYEASYTKAGRLSTPHELADIAGFYKAFGLQIKSGEDRPDHIAMELEFMAFLTLKEERAIKENNHEGAQICRRAERLFLKDHLGCWTKAFCERLVKIFQDDNFYCKQAQALGKRVNSEMKRLSVRISPDMLRETGTDVILEEHPNEGCPSIPLGLDIRTLQATFPGRNNKTFDAKEE